MCRRDTSLNRSEISTLRKYTLYCFDIPKFIYWDFCNYTSYFTHNTWWKLQTYYLSMANYLDRYRCKTDLSLSGIHRLWKKMVQSARFRQFLQNLIFMLFDPTSDKNQKSRRQSIEHLLLFFLFLLLVWDFNARKL